MIAVPDTAEPSCCVSIDLLSKQLVRLSEQRGSTPVLVTPPYLSLRRPFFVELVRSIASVTTRPIRIDWYRPVPSVASLASDTVAHWRVASTNRAIASIAEPTHPLGMMQITASISRPGGIHRDLVVAWCNSAIPLPPWTTAIELSC